MSDQAYNEQSPLFSHKEVRNITHVRATQYSKDTHVIRETLHFTDGKFINQVRLLENYERPFYITAKRYRTYKQHKEREPLDKLTKHTATQSALASAIARALGEFNTQRSIRDVCNSPYVFGAATSSVTHLRRVYKEQYNKPMTQQSYLAYDLETCVYDTDGSIIIASVAINDIVEVYIRKDFLTGIANPIEQLYALQPILYDKYNYTEHMQGCTVTYAICNTEIDLIKTLAQRMFLHDPDVVAAWNHNFDVNKLINRCNVLNISSRDIFSHPSVPKAVTRFDFQEGTTHKLTANGTYRPLQPSEQWHNVHATSGFVWLDAMCVYRRLRSQNAFLSSYGLDNIANIHLGVGKMHTDETEFMDGLERHRYMQKHDKLTYCVYAALDVRLMVLIERQTKDITLRLPLELAGSDYRDTASSSKRSIDMFAEALEKDNYILGTVGADPDKFDEEVLPLGGWPLTLPNDLHHMEGIKCLSDFPNLPTNIFTLVCTGDLSSAYPNAITGLNIAKETCVYEYIRLTGTKCSPSETLKQNLNLFNGATNALDYCIKIYGFPSLEEIDKLLENG